MANVERRVTKNRGTIVVLDYIQHFSFLLLQITELQGKTSNCSFNLTVNTYRSYLHLTAIAMLDTQHHLKSANLSIPKPQTFSYLEAFGLGAGLCENKYSDIPGNLFTEVTINREVKVKGVPMRAMYNRSIDAENNFILHCRTLHKVKIDSNHKESTHGEIKKHKEQVAGLIGRLKEYSKPFQGAAQIMSQVLKYLVI